jgi:hypothetical protein
MAGVHCGTGWRRSVADRGSGAAAAGAQWAVFERDYFRARYSRISSVSSSSVSLALVVV